MADAAGFNAAQNTFINDTATYVVGNMTEGPYADVDVGFVLNSAYLVFFMHCGFAMVTFVSFLRCRVRMYKSPYLHYKLQTSLGTLCTDM